MNDQSTSSRAASGPNNDWSDVTQTESIDRALEAAGPIDVLKPYEPVAHEVFAGFSQLCAVTTATDVAEGVWNAANDTSDRLYFPAGGDAVALARAV
ncbi:protein of unknown function (plasmid) [Cupriavidus taiwanensis]|uniref:Uncharacterized protein n=1 Tax=Cupriavidus taiwanensis TaxID=164546 RepID=A0A9Q7V001_9BURK|nr:protein of unknown function [Cupriavidus taiwanensis]